MSFSLGWKKLNADGRRVRLEIKLTRNKLSWMIHPDRHESRVVHTPDEEDWEALFEVMDRHLARGKVSHEDYNEIKRIRRDGK